MKICLLILLLILGSVPLAAAQGFFIPQKTLDSLRQPEKLPPVYYQPATKQTQAPKATAPQNNAPANSGTAAQPTQAQKNIAATAPVNTPPQPQAHNSEKSRSAADNKQPEEIKVVPAEELPSFNYGDVIEPVYNTEPPQPQSKTVAESQPQPVSAAPTRERKITINEIIDEYKRDIDKISQNQPAENARLQIMLEKYHDEEIIYN